MDYTDLVQRCRRAVGLPSTSDADLTDVVHVLQQYPAGTGRHVAAEKLAHEMAEWIEETVRPVPTAVRKPH